MPRFDRKLKQAPEKDQSSIWSHPCESIGPGRRVSGVFHVRERDFTFVAAGGKVTLIPTSVVTHVFWAWSGDIPDAIQLFCLDYRGFLFRFPGQKSRDFLTHLSKTKLPNLIFFQKRAALDEIQHLGFVQGWQRGQVTTFDLLIWLNLLTGRSFLDPASYPVFPLITTSPESFDVAAPSTYRDFSAVLARADPVRLLRLIAPFSDLAPSAVIDPIAELTSRPTELIPEFFFSDDFIRDAERPKWAEVAIDFIAIHRAALESPVVGERIGRWIHAVFGTAVFQRAPSPPAAAAEVRPLVLKNLSSPIVNCRAIGATQGSARVYGLLRDLSLVELWLNGTVNEIARLRKLPAASAFSTSIFIYTDPSLVAVPLQASSRTAIPKARTIREIRAMTVTEDIALTAGDDGCVSAWKIGTRTELLGSLVVHSRAISCIASSSEFGVVVTCGLDDRMVVCTLPALKFLRNVRLGFGPDVRPRKVVVCESLGFIVVSGEGAAKHILQNFTLNGERIRRIAMDAEIVDFCAVTGRSAKDYLCLVSQAGELFVMDARRLESVRVIGHVNGLRTVQYLAPIKSIVVTAEEPAVLLYPMEWP